MRLIFANDFVVRFDRADAVQSATIAANGWECSELVNGDMSCALGPLPQLDLCHRPSRARTGRAAPPQLRGAGINQAPPGRARPPPRCPAAPAAPRAAARAARAAPAVRPGGH